VGWATISIRYPARVHTESPSLAAAFAACSATAAIFFPYLDANLVGEGGGRGAPPNPQVVSDQGGRRLEKL
jgi:hypothetical protein